MTRGDINQIECLFCFINHPQELNKNLNKTLLNIKCRQKISLFVAALAVVFILFIVKAEARVEDDLKQLVLGYLRAAATQDVQWFANHATADSLRPYNSLRLAALYARPEDLLIPPRENTCFQLATVRLILTLRQLTTVEELENLSDREVFLLLSKSMSSFIFVNKSEDSERLLTALDTDPQDFLASRVRVKVVGGRGYVRLDPDVYFPLIPMSSYEEFDEFERDEIESWTFLVTLLPNFGNDLRKSTIADVLRTAPQPVFVEFDEYFATRTNEGLWQFDVSRYLLEWHYLHSLMAKYWMFDAAQSLEWIKKIFAYEHGEGDVNELLQPLLASEPGAERPCPYQDLSG